MCLEARPSMYSSIVFSTSSLSWRSRSLSQHCSTWAIRVSGPLFNYYFNYARSNVTYSDHNRPYGADLLASDRIDWLLCRLRFYFENLRSCEDRLRKALVSSPRHAVHQTILAISFDHKYIFIEQLNEVSSSCASKQNKIQTRQLTYVC